MNVTHAFKVLVRKLGSSPTVALGIDRVFTPVAAYSHMDSLAASDLQGTAPTDPELALQLSADLTVLRGPFAGLVYPDARSFGSSLLPKLVGTYEIEIQHLVEHLCATAYARIVDVGCAEGYYAIGLAKRMPGASVLAVDVNPSALKMCRLMAEANGVKERLTCVTTLPEDWTADFKHGHRSLIISDCEGYELELFSSKLIGRLAHCDILVESHDFLRPGIRDALIHRFHRSHVVTEVKSIHDALKASCVAVPEFIGLDIQTRYRLVQEGRPRTMSWLLFMAKAHVDSAK